MSTFMSSVFRRYFNPRSPRGGATKWGTWEYTSATISIHAPHEGERPSAHHSQKDDKGISIHAPHEGERQNRHSVCSGNGGFQSTLPTRGSDAGFGYSVRACDKFQSTLPTRGSDSGRKAFERITGEFQSTLPTRGSDAARDVGGGCTKAFQSTLPTRGSDTVNQPFYVTQPIFQSTLPTRGSDPAVAPPPWVGLWDFNPRSPRGGATAEKCICIQHFREFAEYYPLRHGDARCIAPQDCIIQAFFGAKKRCFYVRLCFALKNKGVRG